jgi:hypothetical protein
MIVFGGGVLSCGSFCTLFNDVWVLSNANGIGGTSAWTQLAPTGALPPGRAANGAVYDPTTNRMVIFGGGDDGLNDMNDTWVLANANGLGGTPQWTQLFPTGGPPSPREVMMIGYDPVANSMTVFGGSFNSDLWILSNANGLGTSPVWQQVTQNSPAPGTLANWNYGYDQTTNALYFFGGSPSFGTFSNDVWELQNANGVNAPTWEQLIPNGAPGSPPAGAPLGRWDPNLKRLMVVPDAADLWVLANVAPGNGIDLSANIGNATAQTKFWTDAKNEGVQYAVVAAWGGGPNPYPWAEANLLGAQKSEIGIGTGANALLNYFEDETGAYQIDRAIHAVGAAKGQLKFMAVDVEYCCGEFVDWKPLNHYNVDDAVTDPAYHIQVVTQAGTSGDSTPAWNETLHGNTFGDGSVVWRDAHVFVSEPRSRVQWITDAVNEVMTQNLTPIIYTRRDYWKYFAGNCNANPQNPDNCANLINLNLWDAEPHCGDGIVGLTPFVEFPQEYGWVDRSGNQYHYSEPGCVGVSLDGIPVDLDYFDPELFQ